MKATTQNPERQMPLDLPPLQASEFRDAKIVALQTRLTGEMLILRRSWKQFDELLNVNAPSSLDTLVMAEHLRLELLETVNRTMSTLDQLKTSTSIWTAYALTLQDDSFEGIVEFDPEGYANHQYDGVDFSKP